jgi:DNA repair photolyase
VPPLPGLRLGEVRLMALPVLYQQRRGTSFLDQPARTILNPPESTGIGVWSLNPYVGCEFGCSYCYARYAHRYVLERARDQGRLTNEEMGRLRGPKGYEGFEHQIFVKQRASVLNALDRDLPRVLSRYRRGQRDPVLIGTATDPYQPAERRFGITRAVLEHLTQTPPLHLGIITKSPLVARDADLLRQLSRRHRVTVHVSLISTSRRLIRCFETRSPMPQARLRALERLVDAGVHAGVLVAPILPGITDRESHLRRLLSAAASRGARFAHPSPLRLYRAVRPIFLPVLERQFPGLVRRYETAYAGAEHAPRAYAQALQARFRKLRHEVGLPEDDRWGQPAPRDIEQLPLWEVTPNSRRTP